jgi:hypothetical protein
MKKLILSIALAMVCFAYEAKAQMVNGIRLSEIKASYIEIRAVRKSFSEKVFISLEYGQKVFDLSVNTYIKDDNRKDLEFNSIIDAVNKLKSYGYELFQVYTAEDEGTTNRRSYVLKRQ